MNKYVFLPSHVCIFLNFFFTIITLCHHNIGIQSILKRHSRRWSVLTHPVCCLLLRLMICFFLIKTFIDLPIWDVSPLPPIVFIRLTNQISCGALIIKPLTWTPLSPLNLVALSESDAWATPLSQSSLTRPFPTGSKFCNFLHILLHVIFPLEWLAQFCQLTSCTPSSYN